MRRTLRLTLRDAQERLHGRRWLSAALPLFAAILGCAGLLHAAAHATPLVGHSQTQARRAGPTPSADASPAGATLEEPTFLEGFTSTYTIAKQILLYGQDTLSLTRVTDMRDVDIADYEMRSLALYRPYTEDGPLGNRPVVLFVHGGAWVDGYRSDFQFVARSFTGELGWVTVVIDYRLTSDQVFLADGYCPDHATCETNEISRTKAAWYPDNIRDVAAAFEWTRDNVATHGGHPDQIFVLGHSAGAHLSALFATHPDYAATLRPDIRGLISMSGAFDLKGLGSNEVYEATWAPAVNQTFVGGFTDTAALDEASPATYVPTEMGLPPFYILYAETDLPGLTVQNIDFVNLLTTHGITLTYDRLEGYGHVSEMAAIKSITETPTSLIIDFVSSILWPHRTHLPLVLKAGD